MYKQDELRTLVSACQDIVKIDDREKRIAAGKWLEWECRKLDDEFRIIGGLDEKSEIELRAVLTIIFDFILSDDLEDKDWQGSMPSSYDGDPMDLMAQMRTEDNAS